MTLEDLEKVLEVLNETGPDVENFSWGPSYEFALARRKEAIKIVKKEIKKLRNVS